MSKLKILVPAALVLMILGSSFVTACNDKPAKIDEQPYHIGALELRPGVTADVWGTKFINPHHQIERKNDKEKVAVCFSGWGQNATPACKGYAAVYLKEHPKVSAIITADMPMHGDSTLFPSQVFWDLGIDDYRRVTEFALGEISKKYNIVDVIAHSMSAGLTYPLVQQKLISEGTNVKEKFGIRHSELHDPAPNGNTPWTFREVFNATDFSEQNMVIVPELGGPIFRVDPITYMGMFLINRDTGQVPEGTPGPDEIAAMSIIAVEPLNLSLQMTGKRLIFDEHGMPVVITDPTNLIYIIEGIFDKKYGTEITVFADKFDSLVLWEESENGCDHFSGQNGCTAQKDHRKSKNSFVVINDPLAVHNRIVFFPWIK